MIPPEPDPPTPSVVNLASVKFTVHNTSTVQVVVDRLFVCAVSSTSYPSSYLWMSDNIGRNMISGITYDYDTDVSSAGISTNSGNVLYAGVYYHSLLSSQYHYYEVPFTVDSSSETAELSLPEE